MDKEEVELAIRALAVSYETAAAQGVESALEDQGMEMRVEPERATEGLIGEDGCAGDGLGGCGGVELGNQRENEPGDEAEEPLVVAKKDAKGLGQREDELPMGQGEKQVLVEVLGEERDRFWLQDGDK